MASLPAVSVSPRTGTRVAVHILFCSFLSSIETFFLCLFLLKCDDTIIVVPVVAQDEHGWKWCVRPVSAECAFSGEKGWISLKTRKKNPRCVETTRAFRGS